MRNDPIGKRYARWVIIVGVFLGACAAPDARGAAYQLQAARSGPAALTLPLPRTGPPSAVSQSGIPIHPRAQEMRLVEPSPADVQAMLRTLGQRDAAAIRGIRSVVFRVPGPVTAAEIMSWYATSKKPPVSDAPPRPTENVAGPREGLPNTRTGYRPLAAEPGYLVVSVTPHPQRPQDLFVTVTRVEGPPGIARLLDDVAGMVARHVRAARPNPLDADLAAFQFPGSVVVRDISLPAADVPALLRQFQSSGAPAAVRETYSAILRSAESIRLTTYMRRGPIPAESFFRFFRAAGQRYGWAEFARDASNPQRPVILFRLGDGSGLVMVRADTTLVPIQAAPGRTQTVPGTAITLLIVAGKVDLNMRP